MQFIQAVLLNLNLHLKTKIPNVFGLIFLAYVQFSLAGRLKESFIQLQNGSCFATREDPYDLERENDINLISNRAYPFLRCTSFDKDYLKAYQFNSSIRGFLLQKSDLEDFDVGDLSIFPQLKTVEFRDCLSIIFSDNENAPTKLGNINSLSITNCGLKAIPSKLLTRFPNIRRLTLTRNNLSRVSGEGFNTCSKLQSINLGHNPIQELNTTWLSQKQSLQRLSLRATNIVNIETAFREAKNLQFLDLSDNKIDRIPMKPFRNAADLTTLILANNKIVKIHEKAFKGAINLRYVDLTENRIETLPQGLFDYSPQDELTVELWENPLKCDCKIKWLKQWLNQLSLRGAYPDIRLKCHNPIRNHGKKIISPNDQVVSEKDLTCLSTDEFWKNEKHQDLHDESTTRSTATATTKLLSLAPHNKQPVNIKCPSSCICYNKKEKFIATHSRNQASDFPLAVCTNSSFASMPANMPLNIQGVIMSKCKWKTLNFGRIKLPDLTTLVLDKNQITSLIPSPGKTYKNVVTLCLEDNSIETISSDFLASFPSLKELTLHNNRITTFTDDLFFHNRKLNKLLLGPNPLQTEFNGKCLKDLPNLYKLGLRGIKLRKIPKTLINKAKLHKLDLSDNMLTEVQKNAFFNCSLLTTISLENNNISKIDKAAFRKMPYLASVDFSENSLTSMSPEMFSSDTFELSHVELWQNPIRCDCGLRSFVKWVKQMEHDNPSTEIRFRCELPWNMKGKTSDDTNEKDYICSSDGFNSKSSKSDSFPAAEPTYSKTSIILAVTLTAVVCLFIGLVAKFSSSRCKTDQHSRRGNFFRRQYYKFSSLSSSPTNQREHIVHEELQPDAAL